MVCSCWLVLVGLVSFQFCFESFEGAREHPVFAIAEWLKVSLCGSSIDCCASVSLGEYLHLFYTARKDGIAAIWPYFFVGVGCHGCDLLSVEPSGHLEGEVGSGKLGFLGDCSIPV
jgi:hypothetical protein